MAAAVEGLERCGAELRLLCMLCALRLLQGTLGLDDVQVYAFGECVCVHVLLS